MSNKSKSLTFNFLVPFFGKPYAFYEPHAIEAYLADGTMRDYNEPGHVFLLLKDSTQATRLITSIRGFDSYVADYKVNDFEIMMVLKIPAVFHDDYLKFMDGKYSRMSESAKSEILATSIKGGNNEKVLTRDKGLRQHWEKRLDVELTDEDEVYWKPTIETETYQGVREGEVPL